MSKFNQTFDRLANRASQGAATHMTRRGFIGRSAGLVSLAVLGNEVFSAVSPTSAYASAPSENESCESILCLAINGNSNSCPAGSSANGGSWLACPIYNPGSKCVVGSNVYGPLQQVIQFSDCTQPNAGPGCASTADAFCNATQGWNFPDHNSRLGNLGYKVTCRVLV